MKPLLLFLLLSGIGLQGQTSRPTVIGPVDIGHCFIVTPSLTLERIQCDLEHGALHQAIEESAIDCTHPTFDGYLWMDSAGRVCDIAVLPSDLSVHLAEYRRGLRWLVTRTQRTK